MKIGQIITMLIIFGIVGYFFNMAYRQSFVNRMKQEPLDVQAQYKLERIKAILETYD